MGITIDAIAMGGTAKTIAAQGDPSILLKWEAPSYQGGSCNQCRCVIPGAVNNITTKGDVNSFAIGSCRGHCRGHCHATGSNVNVIAMGGSIGGVATGGPINDGEHH